MKLFIPSVQLVIETNKIICERDGHRHQVYDQGKIESAIATAFYPGSEPFVHGGVPTIAGALCFYLIKAHAFFDGNKRTALAVSSIFLGLSGWKLSYIVKENFNELSDVIERCAASEISKEQLMEWFDSHKVTIR